MPQKDLPDDPDAVAVDADNELTDSQKSETENDAANHARAARITELLEQAQEE